LPHVSLFDICWGNFDVHKCHLDGHIEILSGSQSRIVSFENSDVHCRSFLYHFVSMHPVEKRYKLRAKESCREKIANIPVRISILALSFRHLLLRFEHTSIV
jgi:hypothetical protein